MPAYSPNSSATCFCARALLDMTEVVGDKEAWEMAHSSGRFLIRRLNRPVDTPEYLCFSYTPRDQTCVYNASALTARLLACLPPDDAAFFAAARPATKSPLPDQQGAGAWYYRPA